MQSQRVRSLLTGLCVALATVVAMANTAARVPPRQVDVGGLQALKYWFAKKLVFDVDKTLKKLGIEAEFCTFRPATSEPEVSYRGVGPCLLKNFSASMKSEVLAGQTFAWIKDHNNHYHAIEIQWRPPTGGWMKVIRQYFSMRSEKAPKDPNAPLPFHEFLGGDLKVVLPAAPEAIEAMTENSPVWLKTRLNGTESFSVHLEPAGRDEAKILYTGQLIVTDRTSISASGNTKTAQLKTDINLALLKRPFFFDAHYKNDMTSSEDPPFPTFIHNSNLVLSELLP